MERAKKFLGELELFLEEYTKTVDIELTASMNYSASDSPTDSFVEEMDDRGVMQRGYVKTGSIPTFELGMNVNFGVFPEEHRLIIGDAMHNLRASLDALASELAVIHGRNPKNVHFPFADSADTLEARIKSKYFHYCGNEAVNIVRSLKPFRGGNDDLRAIHDVDLVDKHNGLIDKPDMNVAAFNFNLENIENRQVFTIQAPAKSIKFRFAKGTALQGREIVEALRELIKLCENVIAAFVPLHPQSKAGVTVNVGSLDDDVVVS